MDFDEASREWRKNKVKMSCGSFRYRQAGDETPPKWLDDIVKEEADARFAKSLNKIIEEATRTENERKLLIKTQWGRKKNVKLTGLEKMNLDSILQLGRFQ